MASSVSGKIAFVTGGASGIGAALATKLVDERAEVWIARKSSNSGSARGRWHPEMFAERALRAVLRGDAIIVEPAWWKAFWYLERLSPALSMRVAKVLLKRVREVESTAS